MKNKLSISLPDFKNIKKLKKLASGKVSLVYKIKRNDSFFALKGYPLWFSKEDIHFIHNFIYFLNNQGINTPKPLLLKNNSSFLYHQNRFWSVFNWIEKDKKRPRKINQLAKAGLALTQLHRVSKDFKPNKARNWWKLNNYKANKHFSLVKNLRKRSSNKKRLKKDLDLLINSWNLIQKLVLENGMYENTPQLIVHGDFEPKNLTYHKGEIIIFDLDNCRKEVLEMDLAKLLIFGCGYPLKSDWEKKAKVLLKNYSSPFSKKPNARIILACAIIRSVQEGTYQLKSYLSKKKIENKNNWEKERKLLLAIEENNFLNVLEKIV